MSNFEDHIEVGYISKAHGIRGELFLKLYNSDADWISELKTFLFVNKSSGEQKSLTPRRVKAHKGGWILRCQEVSHRNQSEELVGYNFLVPKEFFDSGDQEDFYLVEIKGFQVFDAEDVLVGEIVGFKDNGAQDILVLANEGSSIEFPFVDEWTLEKNFEEKKIKMDLPEGLLDLSSESSE